MDLQVCASHTDEVASGCRAQVACSQCGLGQLCLPRGLDDAGLAKFERIVSKSRPIRRGEHIFRTGDPLRSIAAVRSGCFKSYVIDADGDEQVLGFQLPGEIIGLDAVHNSTHLANVVALDTSAVCAINFDSISEMARHLPELQSEMFRVMSQQIAELEENAGDLTADQRIARFLLSMARRFSRRGYSDREFNLSMARSDMASYLRLATETVSRVLARFQEQGIIDVNRKHICIRSHQALQRVTGLEA